MKESYGDGSIRLWDSKFANVVISFNGHKSAITALAFDQDGTRIASGSKDTDIIVWDLIAETGLFKLRGHKDQITGIHFLYKRPAQVNGNEDSQWSSKTAIRPPEDSSSYLATVGKDALLKLWDLAGHHCLETHVAQSNGQCWALAVSPDQSVLVTAGNEGELRVWSLNINALNQAGELEQGINVRQSLVERGLILRQSRDRTTGISFHPSGTFLAAHGNERLVEVWRVRSEGEVQKKLARKRKRRREKHAGAENGTSEDATAIDVGMTDMDDLLSRHFHIRPTGRVRSICWANPSSRKSLQILIGESNNQVELWSGLAKFPPKTEAKDSADEPHVVCAVDIPGHRADIRALALSSDGRMLASAGHGALKIWNLRTQSCIRTLDCGYALCVTFLPGDKIVVLGNRSGELEVFDISSSSLIDTLKAHDEKLWSVQVHPDGKSLITGSEDKSAKFFKFEVSKERNLEARPNVPSFRLVHTRTLKVSDAILAVRYSPDARLIAIALLDNTVKVFFSDSLKLFLNLYGHKLPVLNLDISYDSKMIVTCSADKNARLWGLDFGDCHKSFFAHQDTITQVAFVPSNQDGNGHHFFSASKDREIRYWDGGKFERIQKLDGHHGEIWAMVISRTGDSVVTAGHDKSIRQWIQTDEQIFLEEEREKELEELYERTLTTSLEHDEDTTENQPEAVAAGKQTVETLMAGEKIAEALTSGIEDLQIMRDYAQAKEGRPDIAPPLRNPIYLAHANISAEAYLLQVVQKIQAAALQDALLVLTFDQVSSLFVFLRLWAERRWNMPLTCRVLFFLLKTHYKQIVASKQMRTLLDGIRIDLRKALDTQKDEMGLNLAALRFVGMQVGEASKSDFVDESILEEEDISIGRKKRAFVDIA